MLEEKTFSTFEAVRILGMEGHEQQVVHWIRRHIEPYDIEIAGPKRKIARLDTANLFELFLIKTLIPYRVKLGNVVQIVHRGQIEELLNQINPDFIMIMGKFVFVVNDPFHFMRTMKNSGAAIIIDTKQIIKSINEGIRKLK